MYANLRTPGASELGEIGRVLGGWQNDDGPVHLHPGDLGWYSLRGSAATAAATTNDRTCKVVMPITKATAVPARGGP